MADTLKDILLEVSRSMEPLQKAITSVEEFDNFLEELGWASAGVLPQPFQTLEGGLSQLFDLVDQLESGSFDQQMVKTLINALKSIINGINDLSSQPDSAFPAILNSDNFKNEFPLQVLQHLLITYLHNHQPQIGYALSTIGIIKEEHVFASGNRLPYTKKEISFAVLFDFFQNPLSIFENVYGWGTDDLDDGLILSQLEFLLDAVGFFVSAGKPEETLTNTFINKPGASGTIGQRAISILLFYYPHEDDIIFGGFKIVGVPKIGTRKPGLALLPFASGDFSESIAINSNLSFQFKAGFDLQGGLGIELRPEEGLDLIIGFEDGNSSSANGDVKLALIQGSADQSPTIVLGSSSGSRFEYLSSSLGGGVYLDSDHPPDLFFEIAINEGKIIIDTGDGDGFLKKILGDGFTVDFSLVIGFSTQKGIYFQGAAGLEIAIPIHIELGPIEIQNLILGLKLKDDKIPINIGASIKAKLGPLQAVVENMGLKANFSFPPNNSGNLGPLDLSLGFKPPNGIGLSVDAGAVKGGGYLFFDHDRKEYAGALELIFSDWIALKAVGLITTQMPDGSDGFSLIIIITVEFGTGIQLGFGFTLLGVGGLLGLNRTVKVDPLAQAVRTGAVNNIMFPQDVVANAPKIISDLKTYFPIQGNSFLIGPMAKIGYGTPTLLSLSMGIILEFPDVNFTILGVLKVALPDEKADILRLQVNFIGRLEPANKLLWFYAELYDSRVLFITLEGGMGLLVNWGDNSNFVVSVGGFHPRYSPPPLPFPEPPRLAANLINTSSVKIRIEGYFAVTSNTVQFGARVEIYVGVSAFRIEGHFGFDALFQFDPFYFIFELSVSLSVKLFGLGLFSIGFSGLLEGPTPWHIKGKGKISFFFFSVSVPFEKTWGEERHTELPSIKILPLIEKEFNALANWEAIIPSNSSILVSLRKLGASQEDQLVLHPVGKMRISQRKMPLKLKLHKLGNQRPEDANKLSVIAKITDGNPLAIRDVKDKFATGEFIDLDNAKKLSSPGFELYESGIEITTDDDQLKTSIAVKRIIRYETIIIDNNFKRHLIRFFKLAHQAFAGLYGTLFSHFLKGNAVTKSVLSLHYKKQLQPRTETIKILPNQFTVAFNDTNKPVNEKAAQFASYAHALEYMQEQVSMDANAATRIHVIPNTEVNTAA